MQMVPRLISFLMTLFLGYFAWAHADQVQLSIDNDTVLLAPGRVETLNIKVQLPKNFHAYSDKFKITNVVPDTFTMGQIKVLNEIDFYDRFTKKNRKGFAESGVLTIQVEAPVDVNTAEKKLKFNLYYQICSEKVCFLPQMQTLNLNIHFMESYPTIQQSTSTIRDDSLISKLQNALDGNIFYAFLIAFIAGILTSFTPCIFPMIPITISVLGHDAEKNSRTENLMRSVLYVLGISFTYSILGVLAALTGNLFGNSLSNKYVLIGMVILFFTMALSMWGLFDLQVPAAIRNKLGVGKKHGFMGIFITGLISGIVASPCVGPVLVSILSYVSITKSVILGFGLLFVYALGLGLIFIAIGLFGQILSLLPRSGVWMNKIKFVLGLLMFLTGIYYLHLAFPFAKADSHSQWEKYSIARLQEAQRQHLPVMIDFRADWCGACLEMEEKVFSLPEFEMMAKDYVLLKVDATEDTPETQAIIQKYDVKGLPTVLFMNRSGAIIPSLTFTQFIDWAELKPKMIKAQND